MIRNYVFNKIAKFWDLYFYRGVKLIKYELFGLGRFATDHSLTKVALRPLFVLVRCCAPQ